MIQDKKGFLFLVISISLLICISSAFLSCEQKTVALPRYEQLDSIFLSLKNDSSYRLDFDCSGEAVCPRFSGFASFALLKDWQEGLSSAINGMQFTALRSKQELEKFGIESSLATLRFKMKDQSEVLFRLGAENSYLQAVYSYSDSFPQNLILVPAILIQKLQVPLEAIEQKLPFKVAQADVQGFTFTRFSHELIGFKKDLGQWEINGHKADVPFVLGLLESLYAVPASILSDPALELQEQVPFLEIRLNDDTNHADELKIYALADLSSKTDSSVQELGGFLAKRSGLSYFFHLQKLPRELTHFREEQFLLD